MKLRFSALMLGLLLAAPAFAQQGGVGPNYETRLSSLEDQMRALNGQVEQLSFQIRRVDQALQRFQSDVDARLTKLESAQQAPVAVPPPTPTSVSPPAASAEPPAEANGSLGALKTQNGRVTGGSVNPTATPLPDTPPDYGLTPQEQYDRAFDILRKADYAEAEKAFKTFIEKNPKDKLLENAKYWYGETLYVQNKYNESAVAFVDAYQQNMQGPKAPDCLLKLSLSLIALNKNSDACTTLAELKSKYPNASTSVRSRAAEERTKLKCGAQ